MIDSIKNIKLFKQLTYASNVLMSGLFPVGKFQIGVPDGLFRYNDVEGYRWQLNARTNDRYFRHTRFRTYGAYGVRDKEFKYGANATFGFKGARPGRYPVNQLKVGYERDVFFPGIGSGASVDVLTGVGADSSNRLLLNRQVRMDYQKEFANTGFSYGVNALRKIVNEAGRASDENNKNTITTEVGGWIRFSPNEKFYQGRDIRYSIASKAPVFFVNYAKSFKGILGGEYDYQRLSVRVDKIFYLAPFGKSRWSLETGAVLGQVSYPLLEIHRANPSFLFNEQGFSLMRYIEFVSDRYATLHINHDFEGILLNRIPLLKKYHLREGMTFKALYGTVTDKNIPTAQNNLLAFPKDKTTGLSLTKALGKVPYMEVGVGVGNLFGFLRVEYVWRLTYKDTPNLQTQGVKLMFSAGF